MFHCFSADRTKFSLALVYVPRSHATLSILGKAAFPKMAISLEVHLEFTKNVLVWSPCFEELIVMSEILTSACFIWSLTSRKEKLEKQVFCTVSFISTIFALLHVITLVYEFNKLFLNLLNLLNLLIQVGNLEWMYVCIFFAFIAPPRSHLPKTLSPLLVQSILNMVTRKYSKFT